MARNRAPGISTPSQSGSLVRPGNWVLGEDASGKVYLFQEGAPTRFGGIANAEHLATYWDFGTSDLTTLSGNLGRVLSMAQFGNLTGHQRDVLMQSVDVGSIEQGGKYVAVPRGSSPRANRNQGQAQSGSSAVFSPIVPGSNVISSAANAITSVTDFLAWIAWIFHPLNLLRAVEFLTGFALFMYGISTLMSHARHNARTHRSSVRSIFSGIFALTPADRVKYAIRGRQQGKRDVAYREARHRARGKATGTTPDPRRI